MGRKLSGCGAHSKQREPQTGSGKGPVLTLSLFQPPGAGSGPACLPWPRAGHGPGPAHALQPGEAFL